MSSALVDHLGAARRRAFVGRHREIALVEALLARPDAGAVVYLHGPGGVGKSTLLRQLAWLGERAGRVVDWRDARETRGDALGRPPAVPALLLLVDSAEVLGAPDGWLTEELLTGVPADAIAVIAGREPPPLKWRVDPGWRDLVHPMALGNLEADDSAQLLTALGVPQARHQGLLAYTRGHPLALAIASDLCAQDGGRVDFAATPEVVTALLAGLLDAVPGPAHRAALEACAQVRVTTEPLLAALLDVADARDMFDWLRTLSVIEYGHRGLFPQELARDALAAELRWRHPERFDEIHRRAGAYFTSQFAAGDAGTQQETLADYAYLHRDNVTLGPFLQAISPTSKAGDGLTVRAGTDADHERVVALIRRYEGADSAAIAAHWLRRQPGSLAVILAPDGALAGGYLHLALEHVGAEDRAADPGVDRALGHLTRHCPQRSGESASMVRFWLSADDYQQLSPVATAITLHAVRHYLTTSGLAVSLVAYGHPDVWSAAAGYLDFAHLPGADFTVGGHTYGVFGHDWRVVPTLAWLDLLAARETAAQPLDVVAPSAAPQLRVLDVDEFAGAVRAALRDVGRPDRLGNCALAQSRLVASHGAAAGATARGAAVRALILEAANTLAESPRDRRAHRALHHTYLQPAGSQQRAAELLDLPMSTFRRHLAAGVDRLTELLWKRELSG
jgi:energy-coupling factor transporter ATP-binding protein EcfA2